MKFFLTFVISLAFAVPAVAGEPSTTVKKKPTAPTTRQYDGKEKPFVDDSFSFGVEREMKESGEKGGTEDLNIGIGEMQTSEGDGSKAKRKSKP